MEKRKTVLELRNEIGVYNNRLNSFIETFGLKIFYDKYLYNSKVYDLRDYHEIKDEFYELIISLKSRIREYEDDFYKWKSPLYISNKIGIEINTVIDYLNNNKNNTTVFNSKKRNLINNQFTANSEVNHISCYQILKEIQTEYLHAKIDENINNKTCA